MRLFFRESLTAGIVAAGYFACAVIGTVLSVPPDGFATIWPATPFLIGVALLLPPSRWWPSVLVLVPTHFAIAALFQPAAPPQVVATQIGGNLLLAAAIVLAVRRTIATRVRFDTFGSVSMFILVAGFAVPAVVNIPILGVHLAIGWTDDLWFSWRQWMVAQVFPTVTVPPLLVLAMDRNLTGGILAPPRARLELAVLSLLLVAIGFLTLGDAVDVVHWPAWYLAPLPLLLWAAVRLGVGGTCVALWVLAGAIIAQALRLQGPFAAIAPTADVVSLQVFLITVSVPLLLLAALMDDRLKARREADELRDRLARFQQDDRRRIAQELHDSTAQHLVAASLNCMHLKAQLPADKRGLLDEVLTSLREASAEVRAFSYLLNPPQLEREGLSAVLRQYVPTFARRTGLKTSLRICECADEMPLEHQHALLRIAQESLGNVHRHAGATAASVSLRCLEDAVHLVIRDNGVGIAPHAGEKLGERLGLGLGLTGMTTRVSQLGGRIRVGSRRGGTTIHVAVSLDSGPAVSSNHNNSVAIGGAH